MSKKIRTPRTTVAQREVQSIREELSVECVASQDCAICGEQWTGHACSSDQPGRALKISSEDAYDEGWRVRTSHEFQIRGLICPQCLSDNDIK